MRENCNVVRFSIRPGDRGWMWSTFDSDGKTRASGRCEDQAVAAAMVIRDICRAQAGASFKDLAA